MSKEPTIKCDNCEEDRPESEYSCEYCIMICAECAKEYW